MYATFIFVMISKKEKAITCLQLELVRSQAKGGLTRLSVVCMVKFGLCEGHVRLATDFRTTKVSLSECYHVGLE